MSDFVSQLKRDGHLFEGFEFGGFHLSIQASSTHYCAPRMDLDDPDGYSNFEVWIGEYAADKKPLFFDILTDPRFADIASMVPNWIMRDGLLPYAPKDVVQLIFDRCEQLAEVT